MNGKIQFPQLPVEEAGKGSKLEFAVAVTKCNRTKYNYIIGSFILFGSFAFFHFLMLTLSSVFT